MAIFQYEPYRNPYVGSIAAIMGQQADDQARAIQLHGLAKAQTAQTIAGGVTGTIDDILRAKVLQQQQARQQILDRNQLTMQQSELDSRDAATRRAENDAKQKADALQKSKQADDLMAMDAAAGRETKLDDLGPLVGYEEARKRLDARKPEKFTYNELKPYQIGGKTVLAKQGSDGLLYGPNDEWIDGQGVAPPPTKPTAPVTRLVDGQRQDVRTGEDGAWYDMDWNYLDPARVKPVPPRPVSGAYGGTGAGLDPDAIDYNATAYRLLGTRAIPTRIEGADRVKILNAAAKQAKALGQTPAASIQRQFALKSDGAALTRMTTAKSAAESFESKALEQADLVATLSQKVSRTDYPFINDMLLTGKQHIFGDTNTQLLFNALNTFTSEYAKIMEGATGSAAGSSVSARKAAADLISAGLSKGTLAATVAQMKQEMRWTVQGYDTTIDAITERMGGAPASRAADTTTGGDGLPKVGDTYQGGRVLKITPIEGP